MIAAVAADKGAEPPENERSLKRQLEASRVPEAGIFSNQLLDDLEKIWELRYWIPDPTNPRSCVSEPVYAVSVP